MKLIISHLELLHAFFVICLAAALMHGTATDAYSENMGGLAGPAFSAPNEKIEMPDGWKKRPIVYDPANKGVDIVVSLDQQMYPAFRPIIEDYARKNNLAIAIHKGTCGISSGMVSRKKVDIGGYCCPPGRTDRLPGLRFHTIGIAALALIVNPDNNISNITLDQARQIFMGEISRWSEFEDIRGKKGANLPIQPIGRLHCKLRPGHWRLLLDNEDFFSPMITEVGAIPDMIYQVSKNKHTIGYETLWMVRMLHYRGEVKTLKINSVDPGDPLSLISGRYPLYRVYSLTTWENEGVSNPVAQKLVTYLIQEVETLDNKFGLIPSSWLRQQGWKFIGDELVGEPE